MRALGYSTVNRTERNGPMPYDVSVFCSHDLLVDLTLES